MALLGREGLNKVREGGERTPGFFHSKGVSPSEFRQEKREGHERGGMPGTEKNISVCFFFHLLEKGFYLYFQVISFPHLMLESTAPSLGQWMPLTQQLPPSIALKLLTTIRKPQGATKLEK